MRNEPFNPRRYWFLFPLIFIAAAAAFGYAVMFLWNWIMPEAIGARPLDFWKALGLLALCRILFGSFSNGGGSKKWENRRQMGEKWRSMSDDERAQFRAEWRARCGRSD